MSKIDGVIQYVKEEVKKFGGKEEENKNHIFRKNITAINPEEDSAYYFGVISPEEEISGPFHDLCIAIFPDEKDESAPWVISLGVGTLGFRNDYEIAMRPGIRRVFLSILSERGFCKSSIADIEGNLPESFIEKVPNLNSALNKYKKVLPICEILDDPLSEKGKEIISAFIAIYAKLRGWIVYKYQEKSYIESISKFSKKIIYNDEKKAYELLLQRKYVILTGAPGTGKTRLAKILQQKLDAEPFFIQFHAETNYSDFIYGIKPSLKKEGLSYEEQLGVFSKAIKYAKENPKKNVLLIVDEINRANLSNVLGPIFYLFEYKMGAEEASTNIEVFPEFSLQKLPENFYMVGTMNTADRSLAVVDFALRRRFAWYELRPHPIESESFYIDDFNRFNDIFFWYAKAEELNLQPGQGYFFADSQEEMKNRVEYELLPLTKEYLQENLLIDAKEEFSDYFFDRIGKQIYD